MPKSEPQLREKEATLAILKEEFQCDDLGEDEPWFLKNNDPIAALAATLALEGAAGHPLPPSLLLVYPDASSLSYFFKNPEVNFSSFHRITIGTGSKKILLFQGDPNTGGVNLPELANHLPDTCLEVIIEPDILIRRDPLNPHRRIQDLLAFLDREGITQADALGGYCNGGLAALHIAKAWEQRGISPNFCAWLHPYAVNWSFTALDAAIQVAQWAGAFDPDTALKVFGRIEYEILKYYKLRTETISYNQWLLDRRVARHHRALTRRFALMVKRDQMLSRMVRRCRIPVPDCPTHVWQSEKDLAAGKLAPGELNRMIRHQLKGSHNQWEMGEFAESLTPILFQD